MAALLIKIVDGNPAISDTLSIVLPIRHFGCFFPLFIELIIQLMRKSIAAINQTSRTSLVKGVMRFPVILKTVRQKPTIQIAKGMPIIRATSFLLIFM
jgi:hypothetical protein